MATSTIKARNSDSIFPEIKSVTVLANGSVTFSESSGLGRRYMALSTGSSGPALACVIGAGYGAGVMRHKIAKIIESSGLTFTPSDSGYALIITSTLSADTIVHIINL